MGSTNLEIYTFVQNLRQLITASLNRGCPAYAIELAMKDVVTSEVDPLVQKLLHQESLESEESSPVGEPEITIGGE